MNKNPSPCATARTGEVFGGQQPVTRDVPSTLCGRQQRIWLRGNTRHSYTADHHGPERGFQFPDGLSEPAREVNPKFIWWARAGIRRRATQLRDRADNTNLALMVALGKLRQSELGHAYPHERANNSCCGMGACPIHDRQPRPVILNVGTSSSNATGLQLAFKRRTRWSIHRPALFPAHCRRAPRCPHPS